MRPQRIPDQCLSTYMLPLSTGLTHLLYKWTMWMANKRTGEEKKVARSRKVPQASRLLITERPFRGNSTRALLRTSTVNNYYSTIIHRKINDSVGKIPIHAMQGPAYAKPKNKRVNQHYQKKTITKKGNDKIRHTRREEKTRPEDP